MQNVLLAGLGGMIGSILRYLLNTAVYNWLAYPVFPYGTFIINMIGCLLIGFFGGFTEFREGLSPELRVFIFIGILGGFTTFSSFGYETFNLLRDGQVLFAFVNVMLQVIIGLSAVWLGFIVSRLL
jgi:CrcB protein